MTTAQTLFNSCPIIQIVAASPFLCHCNVFLQISRSRFYRRRHRFAVCATAFCRSLELGAESPHAPCLKGKPQENRVSDWPAADLTRPPRVGHTRHTRRQVPPMSTGWQVQRLGPSLHRRPVTYG